MDDLTPLQEEALAIVSIYGPASFHALPTGKSSSITANKSKEEAPTPVYALKVSLEEPDFDYDPTTASLTHDLAQATIGGSGNNHSHRKTNTKELEFRIYFPTGYPETNTTAPVHEIVSIYYGTLRLTDAMLREIDQGLEDCFVPGEVVVFTWIEWLRSYLEELETRDDVVQEDEAEEEDDEEEGGPIVDRKSVFVAHLAAIRQPGEVPYMIQQLKQENKKVIKATHNIMAFRVENENGTISQDNDDDGETAAGSRLLHLMSILDVKNVVVVVSRWYGGIPLSADRFKHINNAARLLLDECGYIPTSGTDDTAASGKKKGSKPNKKAGKR
ncbi:hypothetical protein BGW39_011285 [Mortierella sp. 14UC]|nr:hypothetical protein BGW39_011285 [Mortierella sp. 14UC]